MPEPVTISLTKYSFKCYNQRNKKGVKAPEKEHYRMKKFVKIISLMLIAVMTLAVFGACGSTEAEPESNVTAENTATGETLVMATNASFPPYEFVENNDFSGIDVEIAGLIAEKLGMVLKIEDVDFGSIIGGVQTGKFDIGMAGMTVTEDRLKSVNFSTSYAKGIQAIIVPADSDITSFDDFFNADKTVKDIKIGVQQDTTGDIYCSDTVDNGGVGKDHVIQYKTGNDAVQALVSGKVDAVIIDNEPAKSYVASSSGLKILDTAYAEEEYAICVAKENTELLDKINSALADLTAEGKIDEIIAKYISA